MFYPEYEQSNPDGASYCRPSGIAIASPAVRFSQQLPRRPDGRTSQQFKSPRTAALLNAIPFSVALGYIYLGLPVRAIAASRARAAVAAGGLYFPVTVGLSLCWYGCGPLEIAVAFLAAAVPLTLVMGLTVWDAARIARARCAATARDAGSQSSDVHGGIAAGSHPEARRWHEGIAGTVVVQTP